MCNYFSFGYESRIGLGFEKVRTSSIFANLLLYVVEGFKKFGHSRNPHVKDVCESFVETKPDGTEKAIFQHDPTKNEPFLKGNPSTLALINSTYMCRGMPFWPHSLKSGVRRRK